jgi:hypothetical protein
MKDDRELHIINELDRGQAAAAPVAQVARGLPHSAWLRSDWFLLSAGAILLLSGANMTLDAVGVAQVFDLPDPVFGLRYRHVLLCFALMEVYAAWLLLFTNRPTVALGFLVWLCLAHSAYRIGLFEMGWPHPWPLIAGFSNSWKLSPFAADGIFAGATLYLLVVGSLIILGQPKTLNKCQTKTYE